MIQRALAATLCITAALVFTPAQADTAREIDDLRRSVEQLTRTVRDQDRRIDQLSRELDGARRETHSRDSNRELDQLARTVREQDRRIDQLDKSLEEARRKADKERNIYNPQRTIEQMDKALDEQKKSLARLECRQKNILAALHAPLLSELEKFVRGNGNSNITLTSALNTANRNIEMAVHCY